MLLKKKKKKKKRVYLVNYSDWLSAKISREKELKLKMIENNKQIIKLVLNHNNITRQQPVK